MSYRLKYLKYKKKYLSLKNSKIHGGKIKNNPVIVHNEKTSKSNLIITFKVGHDAFDKYKVEIELYDDIVPKTTKNFRTIATKGVNNKMYTGNIMHRVIKDFMIQGGDILNGNGSGVISIYGKSFDDENFIKKHNKPGVLSMANAGPNTNGSQFFITTAPASHLDGKHVVFGEVVKGMEHIHILEDVPTDKFDKPHKDIIIVSILSSEYDKWWDVLLDNIFSEDVVYIRLLKNVYSAIRDNAYTLKADIYKYLKPSYDIHEFHRVLIYILYLLCVEDVEEDDIWKNIILPISEVDTTDILGEAYIIDDNATKYKTFLHIIQIKKFKNELPNDPYVFFHLFATMLENSKSLYLLDYGNFKKDRRSEFSLSLRNYLKDLKKNVFDIVHILDVDSGVGWPEVNDKSYTVKSDLFYKHISHSEMSNILFYALYLLCVENVEEDSIWENIIFPVSEVDPADCFVNNLVGDDYEKGPFFKDFVQIKKFKNELPSDPTDFIDVLDNFMNV